LPHPSPARETEVSPHFTQNKERRPWSAWLQGGQNEVDGPLVGDDRIGRTVGQDPGGSVSGRFAMYGYVNGVGLERSEDGHDAIGASLEADCDSRLTFYAGRSKPMGEAIRRNEQFLVSEIAVAAAANRACRRP
jgi:hypothetical protein